MRKIAAEIGRASQHFRRRRLSAARGARNDGARRPRPKRRLLERAHWPAISMSSSRRLSTSSQVPGADHLHRATSPRWALRLPSNPSLRKATLEPAQFTHQLRHCQRRKVRREGPAPASGRSSTSQVRPQPWRRRHVLPMRFTRRPTLQVAAGRGFMDRLGGDMPTTASRPNEAKAAAVPTVALLLGCGMQPNPAWMGNECTLLHRSRHQTVHHTLRVTNGACDW